MKKKNQTTETMPNVYLAGPDVFKKKSLEIGKAYKEICTGYNLRGLYPMDNEVPEGKSQPALYIKEQNITMIKNSKAVIANISPFRGPHCDNGTAFEIGYAEALGIPVFLYSSHAHETLMDRVNTSVYNEISPIGSKRYDVEGYLIEDFGLIENLMITPQNPIDLSIRPKNIIVNDSGISKYFVHSSFDFAAKSCAISLGVWEKHK